MSDRPNRAEAIAQIRAQGGYERATDDQIAGTMACAFLELHLAVRDMGRVIYDALPAPVRRVFPEPAASSSSLEAWRLGRKPPAEQ